MYFPLQLKGEQAEEEVVVVQEVRMDVRERCRVVSLSLQMGM